MKCHVTMDPGDGIVSLEQQEQEYRINALVDINVIPFFQAGQMTIILQWKMMKFPEGSAFPSYPKAVADSYWTFQWSNMGPITFDVLLHHRNVQDATLIQNKCIEKILLREDLTLVKNCCMVLLCIYCGVLQGFPSLIKIVIARMWNYDISLRLFDTANLRLSVTHLSL